MQTGRARSRPPSRRAGARRPAPGAGDEQPLDASAFVEAELAAFAVTLVSSSADDGPRARFESSCVGRTEYCANRVEEATVAGSVLAI